MLSYIFRRLLITIPTLFGCFIAVFLIIRLIPGDPVEVIMSQQFVYSKATYDAVSRDLGLDKPIHIQFIKQLLNAFRGDFGISFSNRLPVMDNIFDQFPFTLHLAIATILLTFVLGIPIGIVSALYRNRWQDYFSMTFAIFAVSLPAFWLGVVLMLVFSAKLGWFPTFGTGNPTQPVDIIRHLVLPGITLCAGGAALVARMTRSSMLGIMEEDYIRTARAKGLKERYVVFRHMLRNALIPVLTVMGLQVGYLLGGTVVVEAVFSRRGIGRLLLESVISRDYLQVQGLLLFYAFLIVLVNLVTDILYGVIDPRIRYQ